MLLFFTLHLMKCFLLNRHNYYFIFLKEKNMSATNPLAYGLGFGAFKGPVEKTEAEKKNKIEKENEAENKNKAENHIKKLPGCVLDYLCAFLDREEQKSILCADKNTYTTYSETETQGLKLFLEILGTNEELGKVQAANEKLGKVQAALEEHLKKISSSAEYINNPEAISTEVALIKKNIYNILNSSSLEKLNALQEIFYKKVKELKQEFYFFESFFNTVKVCTHLKIIEKMPEDTNYNKVKKQTCLRDSALDLLKIGNNDKAFEIIKKIIAIKYKNFEGPTDAILSDISIYLLQTGKTDLKNEANKLISLMPSPVIFKYIVDNNFAEFKKAISKMGNPQLFKHIYLFTLRIGSDEFRKEAYINIPRLKLDDIYERVCEEVLNINRIDFDRISILYHALRIAREIKDHSTKTSALGRVCKALLELNTKLTVEQAEALVNVDEALRAINKGLANVEEAEKITREMHPSYAQDAIALGIQLEKSRLLTLKSRLLNI